MLPHPLSPSPSPLQIFQDVPNQFGVSPSFALPPTAESPTSPASISKRQPKRQSPSHKTSFRTKVKKTVRWGSAYSYNSNLRNPDDIQMMWYTANDLEQFQKEKRKIIRALKHVKGDLAALEGTKYVTRGLECYQSVPFNRRIRQQRQAVVKQVLELQRQKGNSNPEALGEAARTESAWARDLAHQLGLKDARTVEMGWKEFFAMETSSTDSDSDGSNNGLMGSSSVDEMLEDECISRVFHQI